jgi:hypothetical protein
MSKIKTFKHGHATIEKLSPSGMYLVQVYKGANLHDTIRLDDYRQAQEYFRAFCSIAKAA